MGMRIEPKTDGSGGRMREKTAWARRWYRQGQGGGQPPAITTAAVSTHDNNSGSIDSEWDARQKQADVQNLPVSIPPLGSWTATIQTRAAAASAASSAAAAAGRVVMTLSTGDNPPNPCHNPRATTRKCSRITHVGELASDGKSPVLPERLPDRGPLGHELVCRHKFVERPLGVRRPEIDDIDVNGTWVQLIEGGLQGLHKTEIIMFMCPTGGAGGGRGAQVKGERRWWGVP